MATDPTPTSASAGAHPDTDEDLEALVASLYGGALTSFVARRGALARALRSAGRRDDATRAKALRKPKVVAWALDAARLADPASVSGLAAAAEAVGVAQSGGGDVRGAIARLRAAETAVVEVARRASADHGQAVDSGALGAALRAVIGDPEALADLVAGRLVDTPTAGGLGLAFGLPDTDPAPETDRTTRFRAASSKGDRTTRSRAASGDDQVADAEALAAARRAVADAERRAAAATEAAHDAAEATATAADAAARAEDEAAAARQRADAAGAADRHAQDESDRLAALQEAVASEVATAREALRRLDG